MGRKDVTGAQCVGPLVGSRMRVRHCPVEVRHSQAVATTGVAEEAGVPLRGETS